MAVGETIRAPEAPPRAFLSIAVPARNEIAALPELHQRLERTMAEMGVDWELVVSDNHSTDGTREFLRDLAGRDPRVRVIFLSRDFGHSINHLAALEQSSGEWTVLMDADLQDEPEAIPRMMEKAREGYDVVYAVRARRPEGLFMRLATRAFYALAGRISSVAQPPNAGPFCLMSRAVVREITSLPERNVFLPGLRAYVGFRQTGLPLERPPRAGGGPRLRLGARIRHGLDGLLAFSNVPLRIAAWVGFAVAGLALVLELFFLYFKLFTDVSVPLGFMSLISVLLFLGGVQLLTLGVIGQYLGRVYDEVKRRPRYVVAERLNFPVHPAEDSAPGQPPTAEVGAPLYGGR